MAEYNCQSRSLREMTRVFSIVGTNRLRRPNRTFDLLSNFCSSGVRAFIKVWHSSRGVFPKPSSKRKAMAREAPDDARFIIRNKDLNIDARYCSHQL